MAIEEVRVLGCPLTKLCLDDFATLAERFIADRKPRYIAVVNVAKLVQMRTDNELKKSVLMADAIGADGVPLVWASHLFGDPLPGRVNGTDLMYELLERAHHKHYRIFFFGAAQPVLDRVLETVLTQYPGVKIAGSHHGYFTRLEELAVVQKIRASEADIIFIAFGSPKKELWVKQYLEAMGVPVVHGVGGSFDVLANVIPRAPFWMQKYGLEWLFRLLQEPRRMWRRYLITNTSFIMLFIKELFLYRIGRL